MFKIKSVLYNLNYLNLKRVVSLFFLFTLILSIKSCTGKEVSEHTNHNHNYFISSNLCSDKQGPDCKKLRLGDDYLSILSPSKGYLYSCSGKNPNAPGSDEKKITWINFSDNSWNFFQKYWLPKGNFIPKKGFYSEDVKGNKREIKVNNLPVDSKIGDWPMTKYSELTEIDRNPGIPQEKQFSFSYPFKPSIASKPSCLSLGAIGVTKNGVIIYNAADARGEDAVAREIVDEFGGHPAKNE